MDLTSSCLLILTILSVGSFCNGRGISTEKTHEKRGVQEFGARITPPSKRELFFSNISPEEHQTFYTPNTNTDIHPQTHFDDVQLIFHSNPSDSYQPVGNAIDGPPSTLSPPPARPRAPSATPIVTPYQSHEAQAQPTPDIGYIDLKILQRLNPQPLRAIFIRNFGMPVSLGSGALGYATLPNGLITLGSGSLGYTALAGSGLRMRGIIPGAPPNNMARMGNGLTQHFGFDLHT